MASYNQSGDANSLGQVKLDQLVARLQRNTGDESAHQELFSHSSSSYNQHNQIQNFFDGHDQVSPLTGTLGSDIYPPPAPTPPTFSHSHQPPGMMRMNNLGPIGSMPSSAAKPDLMSLLRFSQSNAAASHAHANSQSSHTGSNQAPFDTSLTSIQSSLPPPLHAPVPQPAETKGYLNALISGEAQPEPPKWNEAPSKEAQEYLLGLLRPKPSQNDQLSISEPSQHATLTPQSANDEFQMLKQDRIEKTIQDSTPLAYQQRLESSPAQFEYASPSSQNEPSRKPGMFDYKNPFEDLSASSPQNKTPKSLTPGNTASATVAPGIQILKKAPSAASSPGSLDHKRLSNQRSPMVSPEHTRQSLESPSTLQARQSEFNESTDMATEQDKETVTEDLAERADKEAQEALARAEYEEAQSKIAKSLEDMMRAKTDAEFDKTSEVVARDIQKELEREENAGILEETLPPEMAQVVRDIVDEAANGNHAVADSWESAEADEIIVIEEELTPVKVFNFPLKPWISVTLQENSDIPRPLFRDEAILDIARVKKDFDQIDRNLVSATETYIIYGMSKAGGLRVIHQDDGKDAKLFENTKDRIFNVAVSSTPSDLNTTHKEILIGTGVSGTVYYAMTKYGDKHYVDDTHPEQYGFILPPISTQEGDAPGGVLKTRARTSSTHPEYFAVGRGKTINIIWPSYIMRNNFIKPGHDRFVDTDKLSKQCSLRINTGKAGKDFTFSQDDTIIVSLDKSGRVKFWDVRDLTAADEDSDPRFPMPAQTSLEVREPLMTLTTTPEGEKAWPTSVLLLDKQRPYQKRCALRYMIVGMKQNHTLQLWDLALGKPVQEFNLPHSKESDAVCSVTYHPPTGMIVVGHPTRNSIYFLHLSAPKYTIKGLSQVDYIQKLVAKDSSIPEPDSTAVISGVREYSFSNKGVIRSLDMLASPAPATASTQDDEQPLFELYAMHSKGISGVCIKQRELGWTKDNKVIAPVDALASGIVKITKLKELPNIQPPEPQVLEDPASLPTRIAARPSLKENAAPSASGQEEGNRKDTDEVTPPKPQQERKSAEAPVTPANQLDKPEKRSRRKKASEKHAGELAQSNGSSNSSHIGPASAKNGEPKATSAFTQPIISADVLQSSIAKIETTVTKAIDTAIHGYGLKMDRELHTRDVNFEQTQHKLLDVISETLTDNLQRVLTLTISDKFEDNVIPALVAAINQTVSEQLQKVVAEQVETKIGGRISHAIQNQMQKFLPAAVNAALQKPDLAKAVTDKVVNSLSVNIEKNFSEALHKTITPAFRTLATATARDIANEVHRDAAEQIDMLEQRIRSDSNKIDQLTALVTRLSDTVSTMAATQAQFQDGFLKMQQHASRDREPQPASQRHYTQSSQSIPFAHQQPPSQLYNSPSAHSGNQLMHYPPSTGGSSRDNDFERKVAEIRILFDRGEYEAGLVKWLQSDRKEEIFEAYLGDREVNFLSNLTPLVSLAVLAEVTKDLVDGVAIRAKVAWMEIIIHNIHNSLPLIDPQVREVIPSILGSFVNQTEALFMRINARMPGDPLLRHLSQMAQMAKRIVETALKPNLSASQSHLSGF